LRTLRSREGFPSRKALSKPDERERKRKGSWYSLMLFTEERKRKEKARQRKRRATLAIRFTRDDVRTFVVLKHEVA